MIFNSYVKLPEGMAILIVNDRKRMIKLIDLETDLWCMIRGTATRDIVR